MYYTEAKQNCYGRPAYADIIFLPCGFIYMSFFFFLAVAEWMSAIPLHMVWP